MEVSVLMLPCSTCSMTLNAFLADHPPMDTWSSVAALVDRESTEEGWHKALFSETAKTQCSECWAERAVTPEATASLKQRARPPPQTAVENTTTAPLWRTRLCFS